MQSRSLLYRMDSDVITQHLALVYKHISQQSKAYNFSLYVPQLVSYRLDTIPFKQAFPDCWFQAMAGLPSPDSLGPENRARLVVFPVHTLLHPPPPVKATSIKRKNIKAKLKELVGLGRVRTLVSLKLRAHVSTDSSGPSFILLPLLGSQRWGPMEKALLPYTIIILNDTVLC